MIYGVVLFVVLSFVFSSPRLRWMITDDLALSPREEKIGFLFGHYMRAIAVVMLFLWLMNPYYSPYVYLGAGGVFSLLTICFLFKMVRILSKY